MAQYALGTRMPKSDLTKAIANTLNVSPLALTVPNIDGQLVLMYTFFALENIYGSEINIKNEKIVFQFKDKKSINPPLLQMLYAWEALSEKMYSFDYRHFVFYLLNIFVEISTTYSQFMRNKKNQSSMFVFSLKVIDIAFQIWYNSKR